MESCDQGVQPRPAEYYLPYRQGRFQFLVLLVGISRPHWLTSHCQSPAFLICSALVSARPFPAILKTRVMFVDPDPRVTTA
jgi:hypothetical protein